jgi:dCTP deaminase
MILSYLDLVKYWERKRIQFDPDITADQIGLSSIALRFGYKVAKFKKHAGCFILKPGFEAFDPKDIYDTVDLKTQSEQALILKPKELALAFTFEKLYLPGNLAAQVEGKSTLARIGLGIHITAPHIHPHFKGWLTLEMYNFGECDIYLKPAEDRVCQIIYYKISSSVPEQIASALGSYIYQETPLPKRKSKTK